jgi:hypothetical protein
MRVCGFGIARDVVRLGYPLEASLRSLLPLVDELVLNVGVSEQTDDGTWDLVQSLRDPRITAFRSSWDSSSRHGGRLLADETNRALARCRGTWGLYLQADEVLHEADYPAIRRALVKHAATSVEALSFRYHHFYGSYHTVQDHPWRWYRRAIRAVKLGGGAVSWGDAMDFGWRCDGRERSLRQADIGAWVHHYGWCRPPRVMLEKQKHFHRLYHDDEWIRAEYANKAPDRMYGDLGHLRVFHGTHPEVMRAAIAAEDWTFDPRLDRQSPEWLRRPYVLAIRAARPQVRRIKAAVRRIGRARVRIGFSRT